MTFKVILGAVLAIGLATSANATVLGAPVTSDVGVTRVAEGCGPGMWRGPHGMCHPMAVGRVCPPGFHLGAEGKRCWPN
jgi:hypothetical protein